MYTYHLVEFTSTKKTSLISTNKIRLFDVLSEIYEHKRSFIFSDNETLQGHLSLFINDRQISAIKDVILNPDDEICIVTSIAGG